MLDVQSTAFSQIPHLAHGLDTVLSKYVLCDCIFFPCLHAFDCSLCIRHMALAEHRSQHMAMFIVDTPGELYAAAHYDTLNGVLAQITFLFLKLPTTF